MPKNKPSAADLRARKFTTPRLQEIKEAGAKIVVRLEVSCGFHSSLLNDAVAPFSEKVNSAQFANMQTAVYSNYTGKKAADVEELKSNLIKQINNPVKWTEIIYNISSEAGDESVFYEVGPGKVLQGLLKRINRKLKSKGISKPSDINTDE